MISTADLDRTVDACDLARFRAFVGDVLTVADSYHETPDIQAMQSFYANPSRANLRTLIVVAWPLFTLARGFRS